MGKLNWLLFNVESHITILELEKYMFWSYLEKLRYSESAYSIWYVELRKGCDDSYS